MDAFEFPGVEHRGHRLALCILLILSVVHIHATWGQVFFFSGDLGRWLHEVERFAQGERPYRDYHWSFPPLAVWLLGGFAKLFGSRVDVIWTATSVVFLLIMWVYYGYVSSLVPRSLVLLTLLSGFLLSTAYATAHYQSAPLPAGMYMPAAPLGFLFLLSAVWLALRWFVSGGALRAAGAGFFCALCVLTKHDFWPPALFLVAAGCVVLWTAPGARGRRSALALFVAFLVVLLAGMGLIAFQAGWNVLPGIVHGFGQAAELGGDTLPSWERMTIQVGNLALWGLASCLLLLAGRAVAFSQARKWLVSFLVVALLACLLHVSMTYRIGLQVREHGLERFPVRTAAFLAPSVKSDMQLLYRSLAWLKVRALNHLFPFLLPVALAGLLVVRWRKLSPAKLRDTVLFLLGLCIAARLRRSFLFMEWYYVLLEIPVYILAAQLLFPELRNNKSQRALVLALAALTVVGLYAYWFWGVGAFTRKGELEKLATPKGLIYVSLIQANDFRQVSEALARQDPSGARPLFVFAYSGGYNYFLDRKNPTPLTGGFWLSSFPPEKVVSDLLAYHPRPFLLDTTYYHVGVASSRFLWRRWEHEMVPSPYLRIDRRYFERLLSGCKKSEEIPKTGSPTYTLYDCKFEGQRPAADSRQMRRPFPK